MSLTHVRLWADGSVFVETPEGEFWVNPRTGIVTDGMDRYIGTATKTVAVALKAVHA